jgi:hypothetical protein
MASLRTIVGIIALSGLPGLTSCAVVDQYSGRAVAYNVEAEQAQEQALLLNVVRAYLRRPMQFTTVSSITGAASASGGVGYTAPVNIPFRPATNGSSIAAFPALNTWSMSAGMSGGPTFTVPVLDTQEFYDGIMKPIQGALLDLYTQSEYPRDLLFNLFVQKVVMTRADCVPETHPDSVPKPASASRIVKPKHQRKVIQSTNECEFVFHNYVTDELEFRLFQALGDYLLYLGLSTEATPPAKDYFQDTDNKSRITGLQIKFNGASPLGSASGDSGSPSSGANKTYGVCFSPHTPAIARDVPDPSYWCKNVPLKDAEKHDDAHQHKTSRAGLDKNLQPDPPVETDSVGVEEAKKQETIKSSGSATGQIVASEEFIDRLLRIAHDPTINRSNLDLDDDLMHFRGRPRVYLTFSLRSVETMIYYLGEIARRQLGPEYGQSAGTVFIKTVSHYEQYPQDDPCVTSSKTCAPLFVLQKNSIPQPEEFLSVFYGPNRFAVPGPDKAGWSSAVLEIVKQQLALNSSAKSLPQSNVISVVGQ